MAKEEEELLIGVVLLFLFLQIMKNNSATTLGLAKISGATTDGYANAAATLGSNIVDDFFGD